MLKRIIVHVTGLILIALGVALIITQNKGVFPWDAAGLNLVSLFGKMNITIEVGTASFILNGLLGIICIIITKRVKYFYSFINVIIFALCLNLFTELFAKTPSDNTHFLTFFDAFILLSGLLSIAVGTNFNVVSKLIASPVEASMVIVHEKWFPKSIGLSKIVLEIMFLIFAMILGAINGDIFAHVSWFTFVAVTVLSPLIQLTHKPIKLLYGGNRNESIKTK